MMLEPMDGCTGIPDVIAGISIRHCCDAHDIALVATYDLGIFHEANIQMAWCVFDTGLWMLAIPVLVAISTVGLVPFLFGPKIKGGDVDFVGTGKRLDPNDIGDAARSIGIETAVLLAFLEVESAGRGFDSKNRPKMLFEPHVLYRNTKTPLREALVSAGIAYKSWKPGAYPKDSYPRLERAVRMAGEAGWRSASYGLPQILGENHKAAGFPSAEAMFVAMKKGEREQLMAMVALMNSWGLTKLLRGRDFSDPESWVPAVERYNGSGFRANGYHKKAAEAYIKHTKGTPMQNTPASSTVLSKGMKGELVMNLQNDLKSLGYEFALGIDGRFGNETERNVKQFQRSAGLISDGKAGPNTLREIAVSLKTKEQLTGIEQKGVEYDKDKKKIGIWPIIIVAAIAVVAFVVLVPIF